MQNFYIKRGKHVNEQGNCVNAYLEPNTEVGGYHVHETQPTC
jgi:hypothetical protein